MKFCLVAPGFMNVPLKVGWVGRNYISYRRYNRFKV